MAKGGGAWKVAFADFATAMMAFFLVMWATSQSKPVKESISKYFEYPTGDNPSQPKEPVDDKNGFPESTKLFVFHNLDQTQVVGTMVLFDEGSAELNEQGRMQLGAMVSHIVGKPNKVEIRGHTSGRPLPKDGPFKTTWELSYARCQAAMKFLVERGVKPDFIRLSQDAEHEPYSRQFDPKWQVNNSRVEVFTLSELAFKHKKRDKEPGGEFAPGDPPKKPADHGAPAHGKPDAHAKPADNSHGHGGHAKPAPDAHGAKKPSGHH